MPARFTPLVQGEIYHVYNRGIDRRPTFTDKREKQRALEVMSFYRFANLPIKLSRFLVLAPEKQFEINQILRDSSDNLVEIFAFCIMPNHFHFLLKQTSPNGISKFMANFQNSYTRYFNTKHERVGALFLTQFKAVRIEDEEQLLHTCRYIHLNPSTSYIVKDYISLRNYQWSSLGEYLGDISGSNIFCSKEIILSHFNTVKAFEKFHKDQLDYQRSLDKIKHLILE